jgi:hypothetical protein
MKPFRFEEGLTTLFAFENGNSLLTLLALAERADLSQRIPELVDEEVGRQDQEKIRARLVGAAMDQKYRSVLGDSSREECA